MTMAVRDEVDGLRHRSKSQLAEERIEEPDVGFVTEDCRLQWLPRLQGGQLRRRQLAQSLLFHAKPHGGNRVGRIDRIAALLERLHQQEQQLQFVPLRRTRLRVKDGVDPRQGRLVFRLGFDHFWFHNFRLRFRRCLTRKTAEFDSGSRVSRRSP
ncbi:MAG: hypothetical protein ACKV0T_28110 [Planctomycetales bacterium]